MITNCYIGYVKSDGFDFETARAGGGNSSGYFPEQVTLTPTFYSRDLFWDIVDHSEAIKTDWGCWVVKMNRKEIVDFIGRRECVDNSRLLLMDDDKDYLLVALEDIDWND